MRHFHYKLALIFFAFLWTTSLIAQEDIGVPYVHLGNVYVNDNETCDRLSLDGSIVGDFPYVRLQMSLWANPLILLVDEIIPVENGRFEANEIEFHPLRTTNMIVMATGWDGSNYVTALYSYGMRSLGCMDESYEGYQSRVSGLRFMRSSRQRWLVTIHSSEKVSQNEGEACDNLYESSLLNNVPLAEAFPATLHIAENGFLYRLDWQGLRMTVFDDGGIFHGQYPSNFNSDTLYEHTYNFDIFFDSQTQFSGYGSLQSELPDLEYCFWRFEWTGERAH